MIVGVCNIAQWTFLSLVPVIQVTMNPRSSLCYRQVAYNYGVWSFSSTNPSLPSWRQAARLTSACSRLRRLGLEIASRPYIYSDVPQLVLDSFSQYTNATRYRVSLCQTHTSNTALLGSKYNC